LLCEGGRVSCAPPPCRVVHLPPLSRPRVLPSPLQVSCGLRHAVALSVSGRVYTWGEASYGQLGHDDTLPRLTPTWVSCLQLRKAVHVCAAARATFVLTNANEVVGWGLTSSVVLPTDAAQVRACKRRFRPGTCATAPAPALLRVEVEEEGGGPRRVVCAQALVVCSLTGCGAHPNPASVAALPEGSRVGHVLSNVQPPGCALPHHARPGAQATDCGLFPHHVLGGGAVHTKRGHGHCGQGALWAVNDAAV
jgi:hypothetical protein